MSELTKTSINTTRKGILLNLAFDRLIFQDERDSLITTLDGIDN